MHGREDLSFDQKLISQLRVAIYRLYDLDRYFLRELAIYPFGLVHIPHAAGADQAQDVIVRNDDRHHVVRNNSLGGSGA